MTFNHKRTLIVVLLLFLICQRSKLLSEPRSPAKSCGTHNGARHHFDYSIHRTIRSYAGGDRRPPKEEKGATTMTGDVRSAANCHNRAWKEPFSKKSMVRRIQAGQEHRPRHERPEIHAGLSSGWRSGSTLLQQMLVENNWELLGAQSGMEELGTQRSPTNGRPCDLLSFPVPGMQNRAVVSQSVRCIPFLHPLEWRRLSHLAGSLHSHASCIRPESGGIDARLYRRAPESRRLPDQIPGPGQC